MADKVNLAEKLASFDEIFQPKIVGRYNGSKIQVAKTRGEFVWHSHPGTDDFFLVLAGKLTIQRRDRDVPRWRDHDAGRRRARAGGADRRGARRDRRAGGPSRRGRRRTPY